MTEYVYNINTSHVHHPFVRSKENQTTRHVLHGNIKGCALSFV